MLNYANHLSTLHDQLVIQLCTLSLIYILVKLAL